MKKLTSSKSILKKYKYEFSIMKSVFLDLDVLQQSSYSGEAEINEKLIKKKFLMTFVDA